MLGASGLGTDGVFVLPPGCEPACPLCWVCRRTYAAGSEPFLCQTLRVLTLTPTLCGNGTMPHASLYVPWCVPRGSCFFWLRTDVGLMCVSATTPGS